PTNHLDLDAIRWLETFLKGYSATLVFISHDRAFIRSLATRIIELDRGKLTSWPGDYDKYLAGKQAALENEERANAEFDKKLSQEERWIRQGIKARRTRNEGRVRALKSMREDYARRRNRQGTAGLEIQQGDNSGKVVIEAEHLRYAIDGLPLLRDFSITLLRGDRVGILGPNGCGKSTLIRLLLGRLTPDAGTVKHGTQLQVAYFDQMRDTLDSNKSVLDNLAEGSDVVEINGRKKHVMGYLQDFLFEPARARQPVRSLSGGERNRLLLAKLFTKPFNLLVLDEPTNDLDVETL
ncbi:MAG TPA: ABC transporter ATP-binding protein, partial [Alcanivorax sp.]|nr:ABC transporter ATP-binding protein [Alcanivorax sp.]